MIFNNSWVLRLHHLIRYLLANTTEKWKYAVPIFVVFELSLFLFYLFVKVVRLDKIGKCYLVYIGLTNFDILLFLRNSRINLILKLWINSDSFNLKIINNAKYCNFFWKISKLKLSKKN